MKKGFTLIEVMIVLAVIAIIMAAGLAGVGRLRARLELRQAQQIVIHEFNRARSDARRLGVSQTLEWTSDTLTVTGDDGKERVTDISSSDRISIIFEEGETEDAFSYSAPYSTTSVREKIKLRRGSVDGQNEAFVLIYGVRGKVFASDEKARLKLN